MSIAIGSLYSVGYREDIKWYLYLLESTSQKFPHVWDYLWKNLHQIGADLGTTAAIVMGSSVNVGNNITPFLQNHLSADIWDKVRPIIDAGISIVATNRPLPNTGDMAVLPVCTPQDFVEAAALKIGRVVQATQDGTFDRLLAESENVSIQQGHFQLATTDAGIMLLRKFNEYLPMKIPLFVVSIELSKIIRGFLDKSYPRIGG